MFSSVQGRISGSPKAEPPRSWPALILIKQRLGKTRICSKSSATRRRAVRSADGESGSAYGVVWRKRFSREQARPPARLRGVNSSQFRKTHRISGTSFSTPGNFVFLVVSQHWCGGESTLLYRKLTPFRRMVPGLFDWGWWPLSSRCQWAPHFGPKLLKRVSGCGCGCDPRPVPPRSESHVYHIRYCCVHTLTCIYMLLKNTFAYALTFVIEYSGTIRLKWRR